MENLNCQRKEEGKKIIPISSLFFVIKFMFKKEIGSFFYILLIRNQLLTVLFQFFYTLM